MTKNPFAPKGFTSEALKAHLNSIYGVNTSGIRPTMCPNCDEVFFKPTHAHAPEDGFCSVECYKLFMNAYAPDVDDTDDTDDDCMEPR